MNRVSVIWKPIFKTGFRLLIGSWKIIEMSLPRTARISPSGSSRRSRPSNRTLPLTMRAVTLGKSRMSASAETDLPQPDSPTMATISPGRTS